MFKPSQVIGSISAVLSLAVLLSSVFLLTYTFRTKCDIRAFDVELLMFSTSETSISGDNGFTFKRPVLFTEIHGKCLQNIGMGMDMGHPQPPPETELSESVNGVGLNATNTDAKNSTSTVTGTGTEPEPGNTVNIQTGRIENSLELSTGDADPSVITPDYNPDECSIICAIPKFKDCAGVGVGTGLAQFILAFFYIFWRKKTIPVMSVFFWTHLSIFLFHLTIFTVVIHTGAGSHLYTREFYNSSFQAGFCAVIGINFCFLLGTLLFLCRTCDTNDYYDHCGDKVRVNERTQITSTAISMHTTGDRF